MHDIVTLYVSQLAMAQLRVQAEVIIMHLFLSGRIYCIMAY